MLHECLTGSQPFPGDSLERQITNHLTMPPPRPIDDAARGFRHRWTRSLPSGMAKNPDQRYATTRDLAVAARAALTAPVVDHPPPPPPVPRRLLPVGLRRSLPRSRGPTHRLRAQPPTTPHLAPWPPPAMPNTQQPRVSSSWWRNPAVLILAALVTFVVIVAAVVVVIIWPDESSGDRPVVKAQPSEQRLSVNVEHKAVRTGNQLVRTEREHLRAGPHLRPSGPAELQTAEGLTGLLAHRARESSGRQWDSSWWSTPTTR